ncbi:MAG: heme exporter protein CcmB [Oleiphilaceae bacterium]|nr:heme exporter protein CcmB [Oleiphilaceae bacterium]
MPVKQHDFALLPFLMRVMAHDLRLAFRNRQSLLNPLSFFVIVIVLFPLGVSPDKAFLAQAAAGLVWVAALLSMMLSLDRLFQVDFEDGTLEQLLLSGQPFYLTVLAKQLAHWLLSAVPLILLSPLLATMLHLDAQHLNVLVLSLLLGTPVIGLIGGIGAALTVSLRSGGLLISLLVLPLTIPVLIFGAGSVLASIEGVGVQGHLAFLGALLALSVTMAPIATGAALKAGMAH